MVFLSEAIHLSLSLTVSHFFPTPLPPSCMSPEGFRYVHTEMSYTDMKCLCVPLLVFHCHRLPTSTMSFPVEVL